MDIFHDEKILAHLFNEVIDGNGIGMSKFGGCSCFTAESFHCALIIFFQGSQNFDRHNALYAVIPGFEDACHTTRSDMFTNFVPSSDQCTLILAQRFTSLAAAQPG